MRTSSRPKRRGWRWLMQFSLRTLLLLMTLAAVGCWWFLRPEARDEELAGPYLKLWRQVRVRTPPPDQAPPVDATDEEYWLHNHGQWRVHDQYGARLIDGRYADDQPHGKWTIYHTNGEKAAEGTVLFGVRTGLWRTWDEHGTLRSDTTYKAALGSALRSPRPPVQPHLNSATPILGGMIHLPLAQFGGGTLGGGALVPPAVGWRVTRIAIRHGPAKVWYVSGQMQIEGAYRDDLRDGQWTFYDEQGRIREQGAYRAGLREGAWKVRDETREYVAGLPKEELNNLLVRLGRELGTGSIHRRIAAANRLQQLGQPAVPCLADALASNDWETQLLALRALGRMEALPDGALSRVAQLSESQNARVALRARLALYLARPEQRSKWFAQLLEALESADDPLAIESLAVMYRVDKDRQLSVLPLLVERVARVEIRNGGRWRETGCLGEIVDLGWDVVPQLEANFPHASPEARWLSVIVVRWLIARDGPQYVETSAGIREVPWEMPAAAKSLLARAEADFDPRVREAAAESRGEGAQGTSGMGGGGSHAGGFF